ncbi:MAG: ABC transporter substrate-binding protein [Pseudomonadota bacterium]
MRKSMIGIVSAVAGVAMMSTAAQAADCGDVTITEMNWPSAQVVTAVSKFLMEQGYGCKVTKVPSATVTAAKSLSETGKPDIATELWLNGAAAVKNVMKEGKVVELNRVLSDGGIEGWYVPNYMVEKHPEITDIEAIKKNPALVGKMFNQCPEGWGCRISSKSLIEALKMEEAGVKTFQHGSGETLATSIAAAFADKKPWFGYYWEPTAILGKFPMTRVNIGPVDEKIHACNSDEKCEEVGISQYPPSPVATVVTKAFMEREPAVVELMKKVEFTNEQMGKVLAWKKDNKASGDEAAVYFLQNFKDVWSQWINDDAKQKLAALLK